MLTADTSGIADADGLGAYSYQWRALDGRRASWSNVGSDAATLPLGDADVGKVVRGNRELHRRARHGGEPDQRSNGGHREPVNDAPTGSPVVTGTTTEDQVLTADTSGIADADGLGSFSYQWQSARAMAARAGATSAPTRQRTQLGDADVGNVIPRNRELHRRPRHGGEPDQRAERGGNVNDAPTGLPVVTGTSPRTRVLTADTSGIADADGLGAYSYQWQRSSDGGTSWSNVGADAANTAG